MNKFNFNLTSNSYVEPGEECLYNQYNLTQEEGRHEVVIAGVDNGSTQVRTVLVRLEDEVEALEEIYVIPSSYTKVGLSDTITSGGDNLYHKMDSAIICNIEEEKSKFKSLRVVRGSKSLNADGVVSRLNSSNQKVDSEAFYINLIDGLVYSLIMDCQKRNTPLAEMYDIYLGASLPPDEAGSKVNNKTFTDAILGSFQWTAMEYGIKITINIKDVKVLTESESAIKAYCIMNSFQIPENTLCIEDGGMNSSCALLKEGILYPPASRTFQQSGSKMIDALAKEYVDNKGGSAPKAQAMRIALETGKYKRANLEEDIVELIKGVKKSHGNKLLTALKEQVFGTQSAIGMDEIGAILFSGRSFRSGAYNYSAAEVIKEAFTELGTGCEFITAEDYLIPTGNAIFATKYFLANLARNTHEIGYLPIEDDEDEVLDEEENSVEIEA